MNSINRLIDRLCMPDAKPFKSEFERELQLYRTKRLFLTFTGIIFVMILYDWFGLRAPSNTPKVGVWINIFSFMLFVATCRSYIGLYKAYYFIATSIIGPCLLYFYPDSIVFNCAFIQVAPLWILYIVGTKGYFMQMVLQLSYLHVLYKKHLLIALNSMDLEAFVHRFAAITTLVLIINSGLIYSRQFDLARALNQVSLERLKKDELERQKHFLLSFSHEIRNLINTMFGTIQLSLLEVIPQKVRDLLQNSEFCGELLLHLINNILDSGKAEVGELEVNNTVVLVSETLEKVWNICSQLIKAKNLKGQLRIQTNLPKLLLLDSYRITQILMNIVNNSVKFTETGKVSMEVNWLKYKEKIEEDCFEPIPFDDDEGIFEKEQSTALLNKQLLCFDTCSSKSIKGNLTFSRTAENGVLKIVVTDTGSGIAQEEIPLVFNKFGQVDKDPSKRKMKTGLGLFITKQLVEKMGGQIKIFSKEKVGTVIIVCIPTESVREKMKSTITMEAFTSLPETKIIKVMIVDDAEFNREVLKSILTKIGVQVAVSASNGQEALDRYKAASRDNQAINIITMDIEMPVMDGKAAIKKIRAFEMENNLKPSLIIVVSANCSESEIADCVGREKSTGYMKANFFVKKPVSINELFRIIKSQMNIESINNSN